MLRFYYYTLSSLFFFTAFADVDIKLKPLIDIPDELEDSFEGFFFEPYAPTPTITRYCYDFCPCRLPDEDQSTCDCGFEKECGGEIPVDLSSSSKINFYWDASSDDSKYISIKGSGRTRVEFMAKVDCDLVNLQTVEGSDITFEIDDSGLDSVISTQKYEYNADTSFVDLGKCDGCGSCEIYTRLQFDPKDGVLDLNLKSLKFSANYESSKVLEGEHAYEWGTNMYCWMRDSADRRYNRALEGQNTYEILDVPNPGSSSSSKNPGSSSSSKIFTTWTTVLLSMIAVGMNSFF